MLLFKVCSGAIQEWQVVLSCVWKGISGSGYASYYSSYAAAHILYQNTEYGY